MHKCLKITLLTLLGIPVLLLLVPLCIGTYLYCTADFLQPDVSVHLEECGLVIENDSVRRCTNGHLILNKHGHWEAYLSGNAVERGSAYGLLSKDLLKYQEDVFVDQIHEIIPSEWWVEFLHKVIIVFNRDMGTHIPMELREEIYAMSLSCSDEYNAYGSPYVRQLNYHAAHDIGHAMQEYMLVGCSSFAVWDEESVTGDLLVGRNFDFYVGDRFAENKVILFVEPTVGYKFASVSWPGMMGVLSGMNERGLTVTINAAKGALPLSSAMPISLLTRQILQYASTIDEAYEIAKQYKTFVSESILVGSANENSAAVIEKTPEQIALYRSSDNKLICTNHYQSEEFAEDEYNKDNIATSDSPYRYERLNELISETSPIDKDDAAFILRNRYGIGNEDIGIGNEKSINQFIAHHSVIFQPGELRMWVSSSPWQLGEYVCYDMNEVFNDTCARPASYALCVHNIPMDSSLVENEYVRITRYRTQFTEIRETIDEGGQLSTDYIEQFINNNPRYFQTYNIIGDYMESINHPQQAVGYWEKALSLEIPRKGEREEIQNKINDYDKK